MLCPVPELLERSLGQQNPRCGYSTPSAAMSLADQDNLKAIRRKINGGYNGLATCEKYLKRAKEALKIKGAYNKHYQSNVLKYGKIRRKGEIAFCGVISRHAYNTPLLILGCSCAKTAQNNTVYHDNTTSARRRQREPATDHWQDTRQGDTVIKQDSVLVYIKGDTL